MGEINIAIEQKSFEPGDTITGAIIVNLNQPFPSYSLTLQFKGKEETYWEWEHSETDSEGNTRSWTDTYEGKQPIINL